MNEEESPDPSERDLDLSGLTASNEGGGILQSSECLALGVARDHDAILTFFTSILGRSSRNLALVRERLAPLALISELILAEGIEIDALAFRFLAIFVAVSRSRRAPLTCCVRSIPRLIY